MTTHMLSRPPTILLADDDPDDIARSYDLGANSFVTKPVCFDTLVVVMDRIERYWFRTVQAPR